MVKRTRVYGWFVLVVLLLVPFAGCTGDDSPDAEKPDGKEAEKAAETAVVAGSFVGKVSGTQAFVAVVVGKGESGSGAVQIYLSDGKGLSESFSGTVSDSSFVAKSDDGDADTEGEVTAESVTGTVELPDGTTGRYEATPPSGPAGLYELTVSSRGELSGASAAGLGVKGQITFGARGTGTLTLVDGKRLKFAVTPTRAGDLAHVRAGQARLIILSDGELRGVAKTRGSNGGRSDFFLRSA